MFIELHRTNSGSVITINVNMIQYFKPDDTGLRTVIGVPNSNGFITVKESYDQVKELISNATRR